MSLLGLQECSSERKTPLDVVRVVGTWLLYRVISARMWCTLLGHERCAVSIPKLSFADRLELDVEAAPLRRLCGDPASQQEVTGPRPDKQAKFS